PVPRLMVVNSRMTLRSPISSSTRSPRYFLSCGSPPIAAWPWMRLSRPMRAGPCTLQCGPTCVFAPISTPAPMIVNAPIVAPSPITADGSTTALAWIDAAAMSGIDLGTEDVGAGHLFAIDGGDAAVQGHVADLALDRDLDVEAVAGHDHAREACVVDLDQVGQAADVACATARELGQQSAGLRHRLDHQHAGHDRAIGEVALEIAFVRGHVLLRKPALGALEGHHAVDQQEGVAVRQHLSDALHADGKAQGARRHVFSFSSACTWRASASSCLNRAALLRQLRLSMIGVPDEYSPGTSIECVTRAIEVITTRSQMARWPRMPAPPPTRQ